MGVAGRFGGRPERPYTEVPHRPRAAYGRQRACAFPGAPLPSWPTCLDCAVRSAGGHHVGVGWAAPNARHLASVASEGGAQPAAGHVPHPHRLNTRVCQAAALSGPGRVLSAHGISLVIGNTTVSHPSHGAHPCLCLPTRRASLLAPTHTPTEPTHLPVLSCKHKL